MSERMTRAQQQQVTRARLLDAAESLFGDRGIHQTSLDEVAKVAGLTKGAVYANFASKKDLIAAILERKLGAGDGVDPPDEPPGAWADLRGGGYEEVIDRPETRRFVLAFVEFWLYGMRDDAGRGALTRWLQAVRASNAKEIAGCASPLPPDQLAALMLALDIGITLQRMLDPAVPASLFRTGLEAILQAGTDAGQ